MINKKAKKASSKSSNKISVEFGQPQERKFFIEKYKAFFDLLPNLRKALDAIFNQSVPSNRAGLTVYMLGKLCVDDFNEILLLCANGFGFGALKITRSMFENLVDARYLHIHPEEVDKFWNFHLVKLQKLKLEEVLKKTAPDWQKTVEGFKTIKKKSGALRLQQNWTLKDLVARAEEVEFKDHIRNAYYLPNEFVHTSVTQILFNLQHEADGTITTLDYSQDNNRRMAGIALHMSYFFLTEVLKVEIEHYDFKQAERIAQQCVDEYEAYLHSLKQV